MKENDSYPRNPSENLFEFFMDNSPDKIIPEPDDPKEEPDPPFKEIPITGNRHHPLHPHNEEILD